MKLDFMFKKEVFAVAFKRSSMLAVLLLVVSFPGMARTQDKKAESEAEKVRELERRIDLLAAELEKSRTGEAAESAPLAGKKGFAPAASKVYGISRGVSIGGYGEAVYENYSREREDARPSGRTDQVDFVRAITYFGYKFSDRILFNSEIELEHGSAAAGRPGEVSVEFAYLDLQPWEKVGFRAGMVLVPMGFLNELHEAPIYHGAKRPDVESAVIPSTWRENGVGVFGDTGPFQWRAYAVAGLSSTGFTAAGIRGGRQHGARSKAEDFAVTGRVDLTSVPGALAGVSFFSGGSGHRAAVDGRTIGGHVTLWDAHAQYERRGFQLRALFAKGTIGDAALINAQNKLTARQSVGEGQQGWYVQAAYDVMTLRSGSRWSISPFVRYEQIDTQDGVPAGFDEDPATDRTVLTFGVGVKPITNVVLKADFQRHANEGKSGINQLNVGMGYLF